VYGRNTSYDTVLNRIGIYSTSTRLPVTCIVLNTIGTVLQGLYCIRPHYSPHCLQHAAFGASLQGLDKNGKLNDTSETSAKKPCICGRKHLWVQCWFSNKDLRPEGWKPNPKIQEKIYQKFKDDPNFKKIIETKIKESKVSKKSDQEKTIAPPGAVSSFTVDLIHVVLSASQNIKTYEIHDSFIFDTGATGHVCNNRSRFRDFRPASPCVVWISQLIVD
jgi:hypothetical protein